MKIAIIGGGWVGCHLAYKLMNNHDITIFEKNDYLFSETSFKNQNRLHLGYHYPRSFETREMCKNTFNLFIEDYDFLTEEIKKNIYSIALNKSITDFKTFLKIFDDMDHQIIDNIFDNLEGSILVNERYINPEIAKNFFNKKLSHLKVKKNINKEYINELSEDFDIVVNCTNNQIKSFENSFFELTVSLIYEKIEETNFDSITIVDGEFFSIYKYKDSQYTVTDVEHTPIKIFSHYDDISNFIQNDLNSILIENKKSLIEDKVQKYYTNFLNDFKYKSYFLSVKSKFETSSQSRYPIIKKEKNIINCFTGKIQGIYIIENYIKNEINNRSHGISG